MIRSLNSGAWVSLPEKFIAQPEKTVCITGHRFRSLLPYKNDMSRMVETKKCFYLLLCRYIDLAAEAGYTTFMDGLASGTDLYAAHYIIRRKKQGDDLRLIGVMPYLRHAEHFSSEELDMLTETERSCDCLVCTNPDPDATYSRSGTGNTLYRTRNYYMADRSSAGIAFMNEEAYHSGTGQTVARLKKAGKPVALFGSEDVHRLMDEAGGDIQAFANNLSRIRTIFHKL
jgi:uncharacterized phage-like protein YoqJ